MTVFGGARPLGFELCGEIQDSCRYAEAMIDGSRVVLTVDAKPATRVRYAWADFPIVNLYGPHGLPAPSFELGIR